MPTSISFLIQSNLRSALRLMSNNKDTSTLNNIENKKGTKKLFEQSYSATSTYKKESIKRVHIKNLIRKQSELVDDYIVIYGNANVESKKRGSKSN